MRTYPATSRTYVEASALVPVGAHLDVVEFAFLPASSAANPQDSDWVAGSWFTTATKLIARVLIGPGGVVTLTPGGYQVWVRATSSPERVVDVIGRITVV